MIIANVPYVDDKNQVFASCQGPSSTLMVFRFFQPKVHMSMPKMYKEMNYVHKTWFFEPYIVKFLHEHKIPARYYSMEQIKPIGKSATRFRKVTGLDINNPDDRDELDIEHYDSGARFVLRKKLFTKTKIDFEFIKSQLSEGRLVIATVDRNVLTNKPGFKGHFIVLKGFDKKGFICNDAYLGENIKIPFNKFAKAFYYAPGMADIVVVGK
jgi:hypothetical protein